MKYEVKSKIAGFEDITELELVQVDELFSTLHATQQEGISFTVVNSQLLRGYDFEISDEVVKALDIKSVDDLMVYNMVIIQDPLENSKVNFLAPLILNKANNTMTQSLIEVNDEENFGYDERLKDYIKA